MNNKTYNIFDKECTLLIKFFATLFLLSHHLFWYRTGYGMDIFGISLSQRVGLLSKICVSIFVFLSGLGLQLRALKVEPSINNSISRIFKLWSQYIFIVLLSSIIGALFFHDEFNTLISTSLIGLGKYLLTCTGFQYLIGYMGFNPSWWYVTLCFVLYLFFPIFHKLLNKYSHWFVLSVILISFVDFIEIKYFKLPNIINYFAPFVLGMYFIKDNNYLKIRGFVCNNMKFFVLSQLFLLSLMFYRSNFTYQNFITAKLDHAISSVFIFSIYFYYSLAKKDNILLCVLYKIGALSSTIYFMHMFVTNYFVGSFITSLKHPLSMFFVSYITCIVISIGIEKIQKNICYDHVFKMTARFISKKLNFTI